MEAKVIEKEYEELFRAKKYKEAIDFLKTNKANVEPSIYHFNQGVNYAKTGQLVEARHQLELAKSKGLNSPKLRESLEKVKEVSGVASLEEKNGLSDYALDYTLQATLLTGANITFLLLIGLIFIRKKIRLTIIKLVLFVLCLAPLAGQYYFKTSYQRVISEEKKEVLTGPSKIFEVSQEVLPGMVLILSRDQGEWRHIVWPKSHKGWVKAGQFRSL